MKFLIRGCAVLAAGVIGYSFWVNRTEAEAALSPVVNLAVETTRGLINQADQIRKDEARATELAGEMGAKNGATVGLSKNQRETALGVDWPGALLNAQSPGDMQFAPFYLSGFVYNEQLNESRIFLVLKIPAAKESEQGDIAVASKVARNWFCERMNSSGVVTHPVINVLLELQSNFGEVKGKDAFTVVNC